ncbi:nucleotidyltransferase family protein [Aurantiacibacter suaedae]|uniref:nucleotidyltransferase family protein n=1 Tax=Aurantiacibacter suaedae TaxID=2545755 RepID=UPI0010F5B3E9|nr:nucleotidyltransferase family protein [Aurantiacibacter suaedae]
MTDNARIKILEPLLGALRQWVYPGEDAPWRQRDTDWTAVLDLAEENKCLLLVAEGMSRARIAIPPSREDKVKAKREACLLRSMANLGVTATICSILRTHGIKVVSMKGVLRAHALYGRWDVRPAQDTDILVRSADYRSAIDVLGANGFFSPISAQNAWWHEYLGESPHLPVNGGTTVDLHHKVRQPGTPAPTDIERILASARMAKVGGRAIPVMSDMDAAMLTASSLGKALRSGEVWLHYAHELLVVTAALDDDQRASYDAYAREIGVSRLWQFATGLANATFLIAKKGANPNSDDQSRWADTLLHTKAPQERLGKRSHLLWKWTDGDIARPYRFAREFCLVRLGDMRRHYEEARQGSA